MARLILGVTGSVAAVRTPALFRAVRAAGHEARVVATRPALYFFDPAEIGWTAGESLGTPPAGPLFTDGDEWPGTAYHPNDEVLHIEFRKWADMLIIAPLDANTLAKCALGVSDNFLSCIFRAWDFSKPVILAPAMNTMMWESPVTLRHLRQLLADRSPAAVPSGWTLDEAPSIFASHTPQIILIPPQAKRLACGDVGTGAMAEVTQIAEVVRLWSEQAIAPADP
jgi:phosphopantothenoylcysteine decarboxylase